MRGAEGDSRAHWPILDPALPWNSLPYGGGSGSRSPRLPSMSMSVVGMSVSLSEILLRAACRVHARVSKMRGRVQSVRHLTITVIFISSLIPTPSFSQMSSDRVLDFLTEELVVGKNIVRVVCSIGFVLNSSRSCSLLQVTYRSLSHALGIHVNQAKKWALRLCIGRAQ